MSFQQGASEESTFWLLACSGALLSQRSILVAAQCVVDKDKQQTLQPVQVRVVLGMHHQTSKDRLRGLHHLRVQYTLLVWKSIKSFVAFYLFWSFTKFAAHIHFFPYRDLLNQHHKFNLIYLTYLSGSEPMESVCKEKTILQTNWKVINHIQAESVRIVNTSLAR